MKNKTALRKRQAAKKTRRIKRKSSLGERPARPAEAKKATAVPIKRIKDPSYKTLEPGYKGGAKQKGKAKSLQGS